MLAHIQCWKYTTFDNYTYNEINTCHRFSSIIYLNKWLPDRHSSSKLDIRSTVHDPTEKRAPKSSSGLCRNLCPFFFFLFFCECLICITEGWIAMSSNKYPFWVPSCSLSSELNFPLNRLFMGSLNVQFWDKNKMWNDFCLRMPFLFLNIIVIFYTRF